MPFISAKQPDWLDRDHYESALWLGPCVLAACLYIFTQTVILCGTVFHFGQGFAPQWTLFQVWITDFALLAYVLVGFPITVTMSIGIGLGFQQKLHRVQGWRLRCWQFLLFLTASIPHTLLSIMLPVVQSLTPS